MRYLLTALAAALAPLSAFAQPAGPPPNPIPVTITVDAAKPIARFHPIWRFFGADEPNYAYMKDGQKLLAELGALGPNNAPNQTYFRTHNLFCTGDGTPALKWGSTNVYTEDAAGNPVYNFTLIDRIFDAYRKNAVRPYVQLGFMPEALSTHPQPYQHHWAPGKPYSDIITGWAYPPKSYDRWRDLCAKLTEHLVERYGKAEVETWFFECWNEANGAYWKATPEEWYKLHDYAIDGVRRALPTARVGGPHSAGSGGKFTHDFLEHCLHGTNYATGKTGTPLDFISFHAKGNPTSKDGHIQMGITSQLSAIDHGFAMVASFPELKRTPIVIGESDPEGCAACQGPQLAYRNGTVYSSYTAASFARKYQLADKHQVFLDGAVTWAFEFEDQPYFAGFRVLSTNGINLPVLNVFRMFSQMAPGDRLTTTSSAQIPLEEITTKGVRGPADVGALASATDAKLSILLWHYHDDDLPGPAAEITLNLPNLPATLTNPSITTHLIDATHSNAFTTWQSLGSPQHPTPDQYAQLEKSSQLAAIPSPTLAHNTLHLTLPRQGVMLLTIEKR